MGRHQKRLKGTAKNATLRLMTVCSIKNITKSPQDHVCLVEKFSLSFPENKLLGLLRFPPLVLCSHPSPQSHGPHTNSDDWKRSLQAYVCSLTVSVLSIIKRRVSWWPLTKDTIYIRGSPSAVFYGERSRQAHPEELAENQLFKFPMPLSTRHEEDK